VPARARSPLGTPGRLRYKPAPVADPGREWKVGSKLVHPFNPELGVGVVRRVEGRFLTVWFPSVERDVVLSSEGAGLRRLILPPGAQAHLLETGERVEVVSARGHSYRLRDGREVGDAELWPEGAGGSPVERLARLELSHLDTFQNRIEGLRLQRLREAGGLGSFLGGRLELFPHQLDAAQRAFESEPVRWLFADEVGLGKTVEACLVLSALVRTGRARRALVLAPGTLAVQWLGELYRKFHQVFALLDEERLEAVARVYGEGTNPFEVHPLAVAPFEWLAERPDLIEAAAAAGPEVVVLDEAHRVATADVTEAVGPLVRAARHALLLSATPLQQERAGLHRLLSLLQPEWYPDRASFESALERGEAVLPFTSAARRGDVGGLPPRVPVPVDLGPASDDPAGDPRAAWLAEQARAWRAAGEKALVFVRGAERAVRLAGWLESRTQLRTPVFHEDLEPARRDLEVADFRESPMPLLVCSEAGGEGRNFQWCHRMVHVDLPDDPVELEQRIGRLDRIGRRAPVEIVYFRCEGERPDRARLFERLGLFEASVGGLEGALAGVRSAVEAAREEGRDVDAEALARRVQERREAHEHDLGRLLLRDSYSPERAPEILSRIPDDLEDRTRDFCVQAMEQLGIEVVDKGGEAMTYVELGPTAVVDGLPDVPGGSRFLGTFDREEAVAKEEVEFFASGHPLVEGLLAELEDGPRGRAVLLEWEGAAAAAPLQGAGLVCVTKSGPDFAVEVVGADGRRRPEWAEPFLDALPRARPARPDKWGLGDGWAEGVRALAEHTRARGDLVAAAFFRVR